MKLELLKPSTSEQFLKSAHTARQPYCSDYGTIADASHDDRQCVQQRTIDPRIDEPFCDPFLSRWISAQLGSFERRAILRLSVQTKAPRDDFCKTASADAAGLLARFADRVMAQGGTTVETAATRSVAVWGVARSERDDCRRALEAALAVARDGGETTRVLLDVRFALVSRASPFDTITEPDTDPVSWEYAMRALPPGAVITQAFRTIAGLERGLLALSMANWTTPKKVEGFSDRFFESGEHSWAS